MNLETYKKQLIEFASHKNMNYMNSTALYGNYENSIHEFLDNSFEIYLKATPESRKEIRQIIKDYDHEYPPEGGRSPMPFRFWLGKYGIRPIKKLKATGDVIWLMRGLVAISILDGINYRPKDEEHLAHLYVTAEGKGIDPKPMFQEVSAISNNEPSKSGEISTSELIANTPNVAHDIVNQLKNWGVIED
jgi:hypothetical protein